MRETFKITEEEIGDFTQYQDPFHLNGESYVFIEKEKISYGDGQWWLVIVQRQSDKKYFTFKWGRHGGVYYYEPTWNEVKPIVVTKTKWGWDEE